MDSRFSLPIGVLAVAVVTVLLILARVYSWNWDSADSEETAAVQAAAPTTPPAGVAAEPTATPEPEPTPPPDRTSCDEIRGTDYRSEQEQQFFSASCVPTPAPVPPASTPASQAVAPPQPAGPAAQPVATATAPPRVITATIDGVWLLYDGVGWNFISFDANGNVLRYEPSERASNISGRGSLQADTLTFSYTALDTAFGKTVSVSYEGRRVRDEELAELGLPATLAGVPVFFGEAQRSDLPGMPIALVAIKR